MHRRRQRGFCSGIMLRSSSCADNELNNFPSQERNAIYPRTNTFLFVTDLGLKLCLPARINVYSPCCLPQSVMWQRAEIASIAPDMTVMRPLTQLTLALISSQLETWAVRTRTHIVELTENIMRCEFTSQPNVHISCSQNLMSLKYSQRFYKQIFFVLISSSISRL